VPDSAVNPNLASGTGAGQDESVGDGGGRRRLITTLRIGTASVWLVFGALFKVLNLVPRHRMIVATVLGEAMAGPITLGIGAAEATMGLWILSGIYPRLCAATQTIAIVSMNALELSLAKDLLLAPVPGVRGRRPWSADGTWRSPAESARLTMLAALRRHPIPIRAFFRHSLVLTFAYPEDVLRPLLPPGLVLDAYEGSGFVAIALVQTERLRPVGVPPALGRDFFLSGYRIFSRLRRPDGKVLRGLRIIRSDADSRVSGVGR
jgi:hypothetical protein